MKVTTILGSLVFFALALIVGSAARADTAPGMGVIREHFLKAQPTIREVAQELGQQPESMEGTPTWTPGMKKPGRALIFSAFVPGTGELYVGAKKRGIAFLALEAASWTWYFTQRGAGHDKEDEYKDFAGIREKDAKWREEQYFEWYGDWEQWYNARKGDNDPDFDRLFTHYLPTDVDDDYYEMIGKYDQFSYGWIDSITASGELTPSRVAPFDSLLGYPLYEDKYITRDICRGVSPVATRNRDIYVNLRGDANKLLKRASWGISAALFNHVISAVDAALAAKAFNKSTLEEARLPQLHMEIGRYHGESIPKLIITQKF